MVIEKHLTPLLVSLTILASYYFPTITFFYFGAGIVSVIHILFLLKKYPKSFDRYLFVWSVVFLLYGLLSVSWSINPRPALMHLIRYAFPTFSIGFCVLMYLRSQQNLKILIVYLYCTAILIILFIWSNIDWFTYEVGSRLSGRLDDDDASRWNPNGVAICLDMAIYIGYIILWLPNARKIWLRLLYVAITVVMVYFVILAGSRKGIILLVLPLFVYQLMNNRRFFIRNIIFVTLGAIAMYYALMNVGFLYDAIGHRVEDMVNVLTGNTTGREDDSRQRLVKFGLEWFSEKPLIGYGFNQFRVLSDRTVDFMGYRFYAHNNYVELLVNGGIVGFLIYYSIYFYIIKRMLKRNPYQIWIIAIMISLLFLDFGLVSYYDIIIRVFLIIAFYLAQQPQLENQKMFNGNKSL